MCQKIYWHGIRVPTADSIDLKQHCMKTRRVTIHRMTSIVDILHIRFAWGGFFPHFFHFWKCYIIIVLVRESFFRYDIFVQYSVFRFLP